MSRASHLPRGAAVSIRIATRMDAAYRGVLAHGLLSRAVAIDESDVEDSTTLSALLQTMPLPRGTVREHATPVAPPASDAVLARLAQDLLDQIAPDTPPTRRRALCSLLAAIFLLFIRQSYATFHAPMCLHRS
jgi:hypothetical protein